MPIWCINPLQKIAKKSVWRFFDKSHFFTMMKYRLLYFFQYCMNAFVLLIISTEIGENPYGWSHLIDLSKSFPNVTDFLWIHQKTTSLWLAKVDTVVQVDVAFHILHKHPCFTYNCLMDKPAGLWMVSFGRYFEVVYQI